MTKEKALEVLKSHRQKQVRSSRYIHNFMEITEALQIAIELLEQDLKASEPKECDHDYQPDSTCGVSVTACQKCGDVI